MNNRRSIHLLVIFLATGGLLSGCARKADTQIKSMGATSIENPEKMKVVMNEELSIGVEKGDSHYVFTRPTNVAVDASGNIYIIEMNYKMVRKYDKSGKYLATIGQAGDGPGKYLSPKLGAVDSKGNFYLSDFETGRISVFRSDGVFERSFIPGFLVGGMIIHPNGDIILCGRRGRNVLHIFSKDGKRVSSFCHPWQDPSDASISDSWMNLGLAYLGPDTCVYLCPMLRSSEILRCRISASTPVKISSNAPKYPEFVYNGGQSSGSQTLGMVVLGDGTIVLSEWFPRSNKRGDMIQQLDFYTKDGRYFLSSREVPGTPRCVDQEGRMYVVTTEPFPRMVKYSVSLQRF